MSTKNTPEAGGSGDLDLGEVYSRTELFIERNKKPLTMGAVGLVAIVAGLLGYRNLYAEPRAKEAGAQMWKAEYYFEIDSLDKALNGDDQWPGFATIADEYGGTPSGDLAHMYMGAIFMRKGDFEQAISHYQEASPGDDMLRVLAVGNQGDALVELGRAEEAVDRFEKAASMVSNDFTTPLFLMKAGIVHQQAGRWDKAKRAYKRIVEEFPSSSEAVQARKYLGRAEAEAAK
jgi:tetratricopeptide (TPR) repeat protein